MLPQVVTLGPLTAPSANNIALSQTPLAAGNLTINGALAAGGKATLDTARQVLLTSGGDDRSVTFTFTGTNATGNPIQEAIAGSNGSTIATTLSFNTITRVAVSAATASTVTVGTNGLASSPWKFVSYEFGPMNFTVGTIVSGTANYTIEYTYDNPNNNQNTIGGANGNYPAAVHVWPSFQGAQTGNSEVQINGPFYAWRVTLNSQTNPGFVTATGIQAGIANY